MIVELRTYTDCELIARLGQWPCCGSASAKLLL